MLDWYGRNEETINKCLTTAAVVLGTVAFVALTVASAGAVAAAAGVMFAGTALAGSAATLATLGVYGLATVTALFGANNVGEIWSGYNVIRDTVFGGNQMVYDYAQAGLAVLNMGVMQFGSYNSGLVRTPSTSDDPTDETVGSSTGKYAGRQAEGATQSEGAGTTACTAGQAADDAIEGTSNTASGINSITGQISKDKPVVVIGESMGRVNPVAEELRQAGFDIKTYNPQNFRSSPGNLDRLDVEANRTWIRYWTQEKGATIIDIGIDPSRTARSPFYGVEYRSIYQNWNYQNVINFDPGK